MSEETTERLSRYLDGDLEPAEKAELELLLEDDPAVRLELEALRQVRQTVASMATQEMVPGELDVLLEPLRRTPVQKRLVRPAFQWLAAAATVVLGVSVAVEVVRRNPGPPTPVTVTGEGTRAVPTRIPGDYYRLQPLPERENEEGDELLGAVDHLLATPPPEPELSVAPAEPLVVMGPLETEDVAAPGKSKRDGADRSHDAPEPARQKENARGSSTKQSTTGSLRSPIDGSKSVAGEVTAKAEGYSPSPGRAGRSCMIIIGLAGRPEELPAEICARLTGGRHRVELVITEHRVSEIRGAEAAAALRGSEEHLSALLPPASAPTGEATSVVEAWVISGNGKG